MELDVDVLTHPDEVPEQLLVSMVIVVLPPESKFVAELEEEFASGVGSTTIALRELLDALLRIRIHESSSKLTMLRVWLKALHRLLDGIDSTVDVHRQSTPKDVLLERLRENDDTPYVVILDEVDQLEDKSLLYDLYRIPHLTMILISETACISNSVIRFIDFRIARIRASRALKSDNPILKIHFGLVQL